MHNSLAYHATRRRGLRVALLIARANIDKVAAEQRSAIVASLAGGTGHGKAGKTQQLLATKL